MEKLVEKLTEVVSRRSMLKRLSAVTATFLLGVFSFSKVVEAACPTGLYQLLCCCLCKNPGTCTYENCACEWDWECPWRIGQNCYDILCRECFIEPTPCNGSQSACSNAKCSLTQVLSVRICEG
jgi:hypothetical protein